MAQAKSDQPLLVRILEQECRKLQEAGCTGADIQDALKSLYATFGGQGDIEEEEDTPKKKR